MNELLKRSLTGLVFVSLIVLTCLFSFSLLALLMSFILYLGTIEFSRLLKLNKAEINLFQFTSVLFYSLIILPVFIDLGNFIHLPFAIVSAGIVILAGLKYFDLVFGLIYLTFPLALIFFTGTPDYRLENGEWVYNKQFSTELILLTFIFIWIFDSAAYIIGKIFGKNKMAPHISPGKTWEGFLGGFFITIIAAIVICETQNISESLLIPIAIITGVFGILGDLLESAIKRHAQVKDSGKILPGHGGILDRFDSVLLVFPIVVSYNYIYINFIA